MDYRKIVFTEQIADHAARLDISYNQARTCRRVLTGLLGGKPPQNLGSSIPWHLRNLTDDDTGWLLDTLCVKLVKGDETTRGEPVIMLESVPMDSKPMTEALARMRELMLVREIADIKVGGEGKPRRALLPVLAEYSHPLTGQC